MTLVLFVERFLFGVDYMKKVFILVEDLEQFNNFPWKKFIFQMTLHYLKACIRSSPPKKNTVRWHFYGFPVVLQVSYSSLFG